MFCTAGKALDWFSSYLSDRVQAVNGQVSSQKKLHYWVPQSSVLGPILVTLYIQPLSKVISPSRCGHHKFADDTQLHQSSTPSDFYSLIVDVERCVDSVGIWMTGNRLKLNNDKTEALLVGSRKRVSVSQENHLRVGNHDISFKGRVKNIGVYTDATLSMVKHTDHISRSAYLEIEIRRISSIRNLLTTKAAAQLMCSFVLSRLDYCNSLFIDIKWDQMYRLQKVQNHAAKAVFRKNRHVHVRPLLKALHWLPVKDRIIFKIATLVFLFLWYPATIPVIVSLCIHSFSHASFQFR